MYVTRRTAYTYLFGFLFFLPVLTYAQTDYIPLIDWGASGIGNTNQMDLGSFLNIVYIFAISAAALIAVVRVILAGFQYILSDIVTNKEEAKKNLKSALLGLLIIMSAVVVLRTINPQLVQLSALPLIDPQSTVIVHPDDNGGNATGNNSGVGEQCEDIRTTGQGVLYCADE